jgi:hypothetical protein
MTIMESGCAEGDQPMRLSAEQTKQVHATCVNIMRVRTGTVQYDACMESLSQTVIDRMEAEFLTRNYNECMRAGHKDGTADFASCVLDRKMHRSLPSHATGSDGSSPADVGREALEIRHANFVSSRFDERRRREERSCAQLGLAPGGNAFSQCVTDLDVNLWNARSTNG